MRQAQVVTSVSEIVRQGLAAIELDLEIASHQKVAWDLLVQTFGAIADELQAIKRDLMAEEMKTLPSLPRTLNYRASRLAAELEAVQIMQSVVTKLYSSLAPPQRACADRVFPRLFLSFGWDIRSAR
jgi:N12 class adenine-specific DNA methylase